MALNVNQLETVRGVFVTNTNHHNKLNDFIMELQGTGSGNINQIVNDLIFLRREMMDTHPDGQKVQQLLSRVYRRASKAADDFPDLANTLEDLCKTIVSIK